MGCGRQDSRVRILPAKCEVWVRLLLIKKDSPKNTVSYYFSTLRHTWIDMLVGLDNF